MIPNKVLIDSLFDWLIDQLTDLLNDRLYSCSSVYPCIMPLFPPVNHCTPFDQLFGFHDAKPSASSK